MPGDGAVPAFCIEGVVLLQRDAPVRFGLRMLANVLSPQPGRRQCPRDRELLLLGAVLSPQFTGTSPWLTDRTGTSK